ncbi:hypothetical protein [Candidatus Williamhamiltonella defendens]|uniref:hypothetical protein n=1 Tax=Candidatus Williamhamiltonella defendens TaxID=138072 RepID=UPI0012FD999B|nr:hypothetical protein [Candidatus Hamiltonella defensa]
MVLNQRAPKAWLVQFLKFLEGAQKFQGNISYGCEINIVASSEFFAIVWQQRIYA